jgi:hypothetical protein
MCQSWTRTIFGAPSVGDVDHDRDADAVDGWKSEPTSKRHTDRHPPRGVPVAWGGGSHGNGHRAVSLGNGKIRSTDAGGRGRVATVDLDWPEKAWGLTYLGWSETISGLEIPVPEKPKPPKTRTLKFAHISLQFRDTPAQHTKEIRAVFSRGYDVITGTEAGRGANNTSKEIRRIGGLKGYAVSLVDRYDTWVAVKKSLMDGGPKIGAEFALARSSKYHPAPPGRWGDKGIVWLSWNMKDLGTITVGAVHFLTHRSTGPALKNKTDATYSAAIQKWADVHGKGPRLAFICGDFNRVDRNNDIFAGKANFHTCWDDLKKWPNTGHGNIDAIARYRPDTRVKCVGARVLDDSKLNLATDHFLVEATYEIALLG